MSEINLVQIQFENLLFRQNQFHLVRKNQLADFSVEGAFRRKKQGTRQLLGNSAGPFDLAPTAHIRPGRPEHADVVEAGMFEEPDILDRNDCTPQLFGNVRHWGKDAPFDEKLTDELLVARIDLRHQTWLIGSQLIQCGKVFRKMPQRPTRCQRPDHNYRAQAYERNLPPAPWATRWLLTKRIL